jgi:RNA polymerase sigma-70 factor (ECF subfamily)
MSLLVNHDSTEIENLIQRAAAGDEDALSRLLQRYRARLKRMVRLRMNRKLYGRVDDSDVLQDAFLEISKHLKDYLKDPPMPFYLWLRHITGEKLITVHRQHLGAKMRDAGRDVSLFSGALPPASTASLAAQLLGRLTSPSQAAIKAELRLKLQEALNNLNDIDREVLVLRHFEQLSNSEAAQVLKIQESASSKRYLRALERLQQVMIETRLLE